MALKAFCVTGLPTRYVPKTESDNIYWNWDSERDGLRRFCVIRQNEHAINVLIERDTEQLCYDEFDGQLSDGYFEDVPWNCNFATLEYTTIPTSLITKYHELKNRKGE